MNLNGNNGFSGPANNGSNTVNEKEQEVDLIKILNLLFLNKWKIIFITLIGGIIAVVYAINQIPIYEGKGTLIISQNQNRYSYAGSDLSSLLTTTYGIGVGSTIANELQILRSIKQSYELAERINDIHYDKQGNKFPILWRAYPDDSTSIGIDTVAARYKDFIRFDRIDPQSDVIGISFESPSSEEAAVIVNQTMEAYTELSTDQNRTMAVSALSFLREERDRIGEELISVEDSLRVFMNTTNLVSVNQQAQSLIEETADIVTQRQTAKISLISINSAIDQYESQLNEIRPGLADQYTSAIAPTLQRYQIALSELETEKLMIKVKNPNISDTNPELSRINSRINSIKEQILDLTNSFLQSDSELYLSIASGGSGVQKISELSSKLIELRVEKIQLESRSEVLDSYYYQLNSEFESLPDNIIKLSRLQRDVKINEELYLLVSNQFAEMSLWEKTQFGMGRPLDYALPPKKPISPRKKIITFIGLLLGGVLGVGFVFIRELFDDRITSTDTIKDFKLPLLGTIPDFSILDGLNSNDRQFIDDKSVSNQLITFLDHISPISEAYRRLRINVVYANPDKVHRVIMVTSATKGEGKSTLAANLAVTFSEAEKSVLLIDLDLRRPTQHKIFGENREPGLTDSLFETIKISDITRETIAPNVDLITVGKKTPEPATVLDSKRLKQLIDKLSERYDHIILDTAPYGIISDSASLLRLVDGIVVVSRFNITTKKELKYTLEGLSHLNADVLGVVLNAFDPKKSTDYYTNYSYYKRTYSEYYQEEV